MPIIIVAISVSAITAFVWLLGRVSPFKICPICAGVSGTWAWMLVGMFLGFLPTPDLLLPTSILMGGSVVGIAYRLEKRLTGGNMPLFWKSAFMIAGFATAYELVSFRWGYATIAFVMVALIGLFFPKFAGEDKDEKKIKEIEKGLEQCC